MAMKNNPGDLTKFPNRSRKPRPTMPNDDVLKECLDSRQQTNLRRIRERARGINKYDEPQNLAECAEETIDRLAALLAEQREQLESDAARAELTRLRAENERLAGIVGKLGGEERAKDVAEHFNAESTADGVNVSSLICAAAEEVWAWNKYQARVISVELAYMYGSWWGNHSCHPDYDDPFTIPIGQCYSTREAAEAARGQA